VGLFISASDGSDEHPLLSSEDSDYDPAWSPDGSFIVFTSDRMGSADLFLVKLDGTGLKQLTNDPAYDDQAAISPDGKQLVFVSTRGGGTSTLWTMEIATRQVRRLTSERAAIFGLRGLQTASGSPSRQAAIMLHRSLTGAGNVFSSLTSISFIPISQV
jgi:Tol biopolymer transport system component